MAKLYFYYASMNAGKSTTLLQADFNYRERGMTTMLFTAAIDDRYAGGTITSRIGLDQPATPFDAETDIAAIVAERHAHEKVACVLVDEAQFLTAAQVWQLAHLADVVGRWTMDCIHENPARQAPPDSSAVAGRRRGNRHPGRRL